jgi:putative phage-type endonuclease
VSLTPEQIILRRQGLTASDIVVISGTVPFKKARTLFDLYVDKVCPEQAVPTETTEAMDLGHEAEPMIVARVARKRNLSIVYPQTTVRHPKIEWAMATPDALVVDDSSGPIHDPVPTGLIEAKLVGIHMVDSWDRGDEGVEGPPDYVFTQVTWQLFVKGLKRCYVAAMIGTEFRIYDVAYDEDYAMALVELGERFLVDHIRPKRPPAADGSESARRMLASVFPRSNGNLLDADTEAECAAKMYFEGSALVKEGERLKDDAKALLMEKIGESDGIKGHGFRCFWKNRDGYHVPAYTVDPGRKFDLRPSRR